MSNAAAEPSPFSAEGGLHGLPLRCPRCDATLDDEQSWCLECGAPARTRLAPSPNWRIPAAIVAAAIILATAALAFAFVRLTDDQGAPAAPPPQQGQPAPNTAPPAPGQPAPTPTPPPAPDQRAPAPSPPPPPP
ncbi:MAG TPA: hypothetical protein VGV40_06645 [Solirubrobacteraceae bacterium]|nr:hypothetical protein [Solirubrobacteraceae bacterium]